MKSKNNIVPLSKHLPQEIDDYLLKLLQTPADKTKFESSGNSFNVQKIVGDKVMNLQVTQYPQGQSITQSTFNNSGRKGNLKQTVQKMSNNGMKNKDIASLLDIDPSYVSKLKKSN